MQVTGFPELSVLRAELEKAAARPQPAPSAKPRKMAVVANAALLKSRVDKVSKGNGDVRSSLTDAEEPKRRPLRRKAPKE